MPEAESMLTGRSKLRWLGVHEALRHLVEPETAGSQAEQVPSRKRLELMRSIPDLLVLRQQDPSKPGALSDPLLVSDVRRSAS